MSGDDILKKLKEEALETGVINLQKVEEIVKKEGITEVTISQEAKEIKNIRQKLDKFFPK